MLPTVSLHCYHCYCTTIIPIGVLGRHRHRVQEAPTPAAWHPQVSTTPVSSFAWLLRGRDFIVNHCHHYFCLSTLCSFSIIIITSLFYLYITLLLLLYLWFYMPSLFHYLSFSYVFFTWNLRVAEGEKAKPVKVTRCRSSKKEEKKNGEFRKATKSI